VVDTRAAAKSEPAAERRHSEEYYDVKTTVFNAITGKEELKKRYTGGAAEVRMMAHRFADDLFTFYTREPGAFQTRLAFVRKVRGIKQLFASDWDGHNAVQLTASSLNLLPAWSPDGTRVVYTGYLGGTPDLSKDPTLYVVNYSHLDTQWRWAYPLVVRQMLRNTLYVNFIQMEAHPDYVFNWTGAGRYQMFKEYYPSEFQRLKGYVAKGQWWPSSNSWEESDVNVPSSESVLRQLLVGHTFFQREFGTESFDFMLPEANGQVAPILR